jgi:DNA-directed RNA polymerase specialized sigma24 family protein
MLVNQLKASARKVNRLHKERKGLKQQRRELAEEIGKELIEVKAALPHGEFGTWIENNCLFTERTAQSYMKFVKEEVETLREARGVKSATVADFDDSVIEELEAALEYEEPNEDEEDELTENQEAAVLLAGEGLSYRKIANQLGVDESTVRRDPVVRAAKLEADPEAHSSFVGHTHYCEVPSAEKIIRHIEHDVKYITGPKFRLTKKDRKRVIKALREGLEALDA